MQKLKTALLAMLAEGAYKTARNEANSACICFAYQPEMPKQLKEQKKQLK